MGYPSLDCENGRFVSFGFASGNIKILKKEN